MRARILSSRVTKLSLPNGRPVPARSRITPARRPILRNYQLLDAHGAGAQRTNPKTGNPDVYPHGHGPRGGHYQDL